MGGGFLAEVVGCGVVVPVPVLELELVGWGLVSPVWAAVMRTGGAEVARVVGAILVAWERVCAVVE